MIPVCMGYADEHQTLTTSTAITSFFHHSSFATNLLQLIKKRTNNTDIKGIQAVGKTRFLSTYYHMTSVKVILDVSYFHDRL